MIRFLTRRAVEVIPVLIIVSFAIFMMVRLVPGDPARTLAGADASEQNVAQIRDRLGLTGSPIVQYGHWVARALRLDFGRSFVYGAPVKHVIRTQLEPTLQLAVSAYLLTLLIGVGLGVLAAQNVYWDFAANVLAAVTLALPTFVLGILMLVVFAAKWHLLPAGGWAPLESDPLEAVRRLILPTIALGLLTGVVLMRFVRTQMREVLRQDYVRTARAKGLANRTVTIRHALRNALIPVVTVAALQVGRLLGGALIIEVVFSRPGIGRLLVDAITARDYPLVQALILLLVLVFVATNLLADMIYGLVDPRLRQA